jgi:hypothetical protein
MKDLRITRPLQVVDDPAYLMGKAKNVTTTGDGTGTPWSDDVINDQLFGVNSAILAEAGMTPNGLDEKAGQSQIVDAVKKIIADNHNIRVRTLAQAVAEDASVGTRYIITDLDNARYDVTISGDVGGFYKIGLSSGRKLRLMETDLSCKALGMSTTDSSINSDILDTLDQFNWSSLEIDDYYEFTTSVVNVMPNRKIKIFGNGELRGVNAFLTFQGSLEDYGQIISAGTKGSNNIAVSDTTGLNSGDLIIIHNKNPFSYSPHRAAYHDGEFNIVRSVTGVSTLTVERLLKSYYGTLTNIRLFKLNPIEIDINAKITCTGSAIYALAVKYGANCNFGPFANIRAVNSSNAVGALLVDKISGATFDRGRYFNDAPANGTQYGINISSCENITGIGVIEAHAARHGITTGSDGTDGGVPCDNIWFYQTKITNDGNGIYSADFHGNTRNSGYVDCEIDNDIGVGGENITVDNNVIVAKRNNPPIELQEIVGGKITITNNKVKMSQDFNFNTLIAFSSSTLSQKVSKDFSLVIKNNTFELKSSVTELVTVLYNQDDAVKSTLSISGFDITGDSSGLTKYASLARSGSGLNPSHVEIKGNRHNLNSSSSYVTLSGLFTGTVVSLPSQRCPAVSLTILSGQSESTTGGSGDTGLYVWDYVGYPSTPHVSCDHNGWVRGGDPHLFMALEAVSPDNCQIYSTTGSNSLTVGADRVLTINAVVSYDAVTL